MFITPIIKEMTSVRKRGIILLVLLIVLGLGPVSALATPTQDIVNEVSQAKYTDYLDDYLYAHTGDDRGLIGAQHDLARANIYSAFEGFGLSTSLDPFLYSGSTYYNVVGVHTGTVHPEQIYIAGAHYDSVNNPGADDNASGVAGVLEAARVLSQHEFESTLIFIAFDREEQGLYGSAAYASAHNADDIQAMISLDMIAYNPAANPDKAGIYYATDNTPLTQALSDSLSTYGGITATIGQMGRSDHESFDNNNFSSCLLIECNFSGTWANPNYHKATDALETPNYIDFAYATNMTRGAVGYLVESATLVIIPEPAGLGLIAMVLLVIRHRRC